MSVIRIPIKCGLCGKTMYGPSAALLQDDSQQEARTTFEKLNRHIYEKHPAEFGLILALSTSFMNWKIANFFLTDAKDVADAADRYRWHIHQETIACRAIRLRERAAMLAEDIGKLPPSVHWMEAATDLIHSCLEELRQITEEPDKYPPPEPLPLPGEQPGPKIVV